MAKPVQIMETVLRDGHQSLCATRMHYSQMEPMLDSLDRIGYKALEAWGGATFDTCLRFLDEDPWERLDKLKAHLKTPIQMLLRGQNLLGYNHYSNDVVEKFVHMASANLTYPLCIRNARPYQQASLQVRQRFRSYEQG